MTVTPIASTSTAQPFDVSTLPKVNASLADATPQEILKWAVDNLPGLYQTTAFGLTGLAATDMISRLSKRSGSKEHLVPLIFIDTLYHFKETLDLVAKVEKKYNLKVKVYKPAGVENVEEFENMYGKELWTSDDETYDFVVKVEPARRAYEELGVKAVITGRRRSQGADRANLQAIEVDSTGLIKVNPLLNWSFDDVKDYVDMAGVPYNVLLDKGYKSVGDWHSTVPSTDAGNERGGRWVDKAAKTECGLHVDYFKMKKAFEKKQREAALAAADVARGDATLGETSVALGLLEIK